MYYLLRDLLFHFPPEEVHYFSMNMLHKACSIPPIKKIISKNFSLQHPSLERELFGLHFKNPVGLGAGFDKNASYLNELEALGFGFVEIGTVTPKAQPGNEQPRVFRLPKDKALINRMGFNNEGVNAVRNRLEKWNNSRLTTPDSRLIIGGNIGKNKITANEDAWKDYEICFNELFDVADYFVVNVSSPNTPGLRELQEKESLRKILSHLQNINQSKTSERETKEKKGEKQSILGELCQSNADEPTNDCTIHRQSNGTQKMWWKWRALEREKRCKTSNQPLQP